MFDLSLGGVAEINLSSAEILGRIQKIWEMYKSVSPLQIPNSIVMTRLKLLSCDGSLQHNLLYQS